MTVNGLSTINLSTLTGFQQALMYILMCAGHPIAVSLIIIQSRMWMFEEHLEPLVRKRREEREARKLRRGESKWSTRILTRIKTWTKRDEAKVDVELAETDGDSTSVKRGRLRASMIRRVNNAPQRINPSGLVMDSRMAEAVSQPPPTIEASPPILHESPRSMPTQISQESPPAIEIRQATGDNEASPGDSTVMYRSPTISLANRRPTRDIRQNSIMAEDKATTSAFPHSQTIEFSLSKPARTTSIDREAKRDFSSFSMQGHSERKERQMSHPVDTMSRSYGGPGLDRYPSRVATTFPRTMTGASQRRKGSKHTGFGGFPTPYRLLIKFVSWMAPGLAERIRLRLTVPRTPSMAFKNTKSMAAETIEAALQTEHKLIEKDLEFLGGVEYKSLKLLRLIVLSYHIGIQVIGMAIIVGEASRKKWLPAFEAQPRFVPPAWFAVFQATSAYTNTGTSLMDLSMIPFQGATLMIITMFILILAGNTAFPIFLRLIIWGIKKATDANAPIQSQLHFLLAHPRRCFIYLFPSHQTWFLLTMIVTLTITDWVCFLVLDIGNPVTEAVPVGTRVLIGLLQASAVRAAGFATISISALAPAVKVLYVIMMYVSIYPVALSVRASNEYEERSLGIFVEPDNDSESSSLLSQEREFGKRTGVSRRKIWGEYLVWHAKQQLAFDMWWLALALWLICIIERGPLSDNTELRWFDIFTVIFELVSAYGTVGLSLGVPFDNFSTSGAFKPLSKLIMCAVMVRGRHRGLPVAIDRAIVLPSEYNKENAFMPPFEGFNSLGAGEMSHGRVSSIKPSNPPVEPEPHIPKMHLEAVPESGQPSPAMKPMQDGRPISPSALSFSTQDTREASTTRDGSTPQK
ncbi:related to potassium transporter TRK-1 [Serendipita indica DSM 11827]|uniref:Related to potassium transporter TRK-1 n=1 Tax=Serendipita indica (strain DSM 11827) TaxID=1109443 RepID=G4T4T9_SERID|nr:related to potassium transporter TRK-1 [Serendipita indica DSM 11827]